MAMTDWMPTLAEKIAAVSGLQYVYFPDPTDADAGLPGTLRVFPCAVILPRQGSQVYSTGGPNIAIHRLRITVYAANQVLAESYAVAIPYIKSIRDKLAANVQLGGLAGIDHVLPDTSQAVFYDGPGGIKYGDTEHLGIIFYVEVKEHETFTVSA